MGMVRTESLFLEIPGVTLEKNGYFILIFTSHFFTFNIFLKPVFRIFSSQFVPDDGPINKGPSRPAGGVYRRSGVFPMGGVLQFQSTHVYGAEVEL